MQEADTASPSKEHNFHAKISRTVFQIFVKIKRTTYSCVLLESIKIKFMTLNTVSRSMDAVQLRCKKKGEEIDTLSQRTNLHRKYSP